MPYSNLCFSFLWMQKTKNPNWLKHLWNQCDTNDTIKFNSLKLMMFRSLVQCIHYFILFLSMISNEPPFLSVFSLQFDTLLSDQWYGFINVISWLSKHWLWSKPLWWGLVMVEAQAQAHSLNFFRWLLWIFSFFLFFFCPFLCSIACALTTFILLDM